MEMVFPTTGLLPAPSLMGTLSSPSYSSSRPSVHPPTADRPRPPNASVRLRSSARADPPAAHAPAPRRLDNEAMALLTRVPASADVLESSLVGIGVISVAAAVALEFAASRTRQQQVQQAAPILPSVGAIETAACWSRRILARRLAAAHRTSCAVVVPTHQSAQARRRRCLLAVRSLCSVAQSRAKICRACRRRSTSTGWPRWRTASRRCAPRRRWRRRRGGAAATRCPACGSRRCRPDRARYGPCQGASATSPATCQTGPVLAGNCMDSICNLSLTSSPVGERVEQFSKRATVWCIALSATGSGLCVGDTGPLVRRSIKPGKLATTTWC